MGSITAIRHFHACRSQLENETPEYACGNRFADMQCCVQELRVSREAGDSDLQALDSSWKQRDKKPDEAAKGVLDVTASYARSCVDSIVKSEALLVMSPQQQALCAVCTALENYDMPADGCLRRYTRLCSQDESVQQQAETSLRVRSL